MWYVTAKKKPDWTAAVKYLRRADPVLAKMIRKVGECRIVPRRDYYTVLCVAIFNQQISTKIATILYNRFRSQFPRKRPNPKLVLDFLQRDPELAKKCGVSRHKRGYLIDLSQHFIDKRIPVRKLARMSDDEVIECLSQV